MGEDAQLAGAKGIRRAKRWLCATMRVTSVWANTDSASSKAKLAYRWPHGGSTFSFDIGGLMRGGEFENQTFSAEVKYYAIDHNQHAQYKTFLAHCYVALAQNASMCDHFMWITWAPFGTTTWKDLRSAEYVRKAVLDHSDQIFGTSDAEVVAVQLDEDRVKDVAERLWIVVLSEKQEKLVPLEDWRKVINSYLTSDGSDEA